MGAVKRLTAISVQLAELDFAKAPNFLINGLKREELIATNSTSIPVGAFRSLAMEDKLQWAIAAACLVVTVILQAEVAAQQNAGSEDRPDSRRIGAADGLTALIGLVSLAVLFKCGRSTIRC